MSIAELLEKYGLDVVLIALISIFLVGCVKVLFSKALKKVGRGAAKTVYETLSISFALALSAAWMLLKGKFGLQADVFTADLFIKRSTLVYAAVKIMYPLYENYHLRDLVRLIGKLIYKMFKGNGETKEAKAEETETKTTIVL